MFKYALFFLLASCLSLIFACTEKTKLTSPSESLIGPSVSKIQSGLPPNLHAQLEIFNKQTHRVEFNGCTIRHNEKDFIVGDSLEDLIRVLGKYNIAQSHFLVWKEIGLVVTVDSPENAKKVVAVNVFFDNYRHEDTFPFLYTKGDTLLFDGVPLNSKITSAEFMAQSKWDWNDFLISDFRLKYRYQCSNKDAKNITYGLGLDGIWNNKGSGHLTLKDLVDHSNSNPFNGLFLSIE
jgi:hypothetical protein